jgi:hypothetical protein
MNPTHPTARDPFPFELALRLGMTVGELRARLTYVEYLEWIAYKAARVQQRIQLSKSKKTLVDW